MNTLCFLLIFGLSQSAFGFRLYNAHVAFNVDFEQSGAGYRSFYNFISKWVDVEGSGNVERDMIAKDQVKLISLKFHFNNKIVPDWSEMLRNMSVEVCQFKPFRFTIAQSSFGTLMFAANDAALTSFSERLTTVMKQRNFDPYSSNMADLLRIPMGQLSTNHRIRHQGDDPTDMFIQIGPHISVHLCTDDDTPSRDCPAVATADFDCKSN